MKTVFPFVWDYNFSACVSTADIFNPFIESAFNLSSSQIFTTGYPRNDVFFCNDNSSSLIKEWNVKFNSPQKIIYLPTFRDHDPKCDLLFKYGFDLDKWQKLLINRNSILIMKPHFASSMINMTKDDFDRIIVLEDDGFLDLNLLLKDIDILITDYSGAYFDFNLLNKPIILAPFDFNDYISKSRELYFNYSDFPNSKVNTWEELYSLIDECKFKKGEIIGERYNKYYDGNSSERLFNAINRLN